MNTNSSIFGAIGGPVSSPSAKVTQETKEFKETKESKETNESKLTKEPTNFSQNYILPKNSPKKNRASQKHTKMNILYKDDTSSEFFIGGLNKEKTRDELFRELSNIRLKNGDRLYVRKFNMPKINAYKDDKNRIICTPGYAFVTTKYPWMAQELILAGTILLNGFKAEIKSIQAVKRLNSRKNEFEKKRDLKSDLKAVIGSGRNPSVFQESQQETNNNSIFDKLDFDSKCGLGGLGGLDTGFEHQIKFENQLNVFSPDPSGFGQNGFKTYFEANEFSTHGNNLFNYL